MDALYKLKLSLTLTVISEPAIHLTTYYVLAVPGREVNMSFTGGNRVQLKIVVGSGVQHVDGQIGQIHRQNGAV